MRAEAAHAHATLMMEQAAAAAAAEEDVQLAWQGAELMRQGPGLELELAMGCDRSWAAPQLQRLAVADDTDDTRRELIWMGIELMRQGDAADAEASFSESAWASRR